MRILVIGGGHLATSIVERLESEGHDLIVFSRTQNPILKCRQIIGDIFDFPEFVKTLTLRPQIIIQTAWITTPGVYKNDVSNFKYAKFSCDLAQYIRSSGVEHLIVLGTCAEYGHQSSPSAAGITDLCPNSLYAEQKVFAFNSIKEILHNSDTRFSWARIFYPYGPNQHHKRLIPHLIHSLKNNISIKLADTSSVYDWTTTRDIASAISWIIDSYNPIELDIGTSFGFTNIELLEALTNLLPCKTKFPRIDEHDIGTKEVFVVDKKSPLFLSGWVPKDSLISGLEWVLSS